MARRISVVLSQNQRPNPTQRDFEGTLVAELLMVHGIEVTLIPDLATLHDGDTGMLCLEGIMGDMVLLCWYSSEQAMQQLHQRGVLGRLGRTTFDEVVEKDEPMANLRTVFAINMAQLPSVQQCCEEIHRIREEVAVKTYDLGISMVSEETAMDAVPKPAPETSKPQSVKPQSVTDDPPAEQESPESDPDEASLDRLMDQLDAWDT